MKLPIEKVLAYVLLFSCALLFLKLSPEMISDGNSLLQSKTGQNEIFEEVSEFSVQEEQLPTRYDGRENDIHPVIKKQGNKGDCWAIAATTALEASLLPGEHLVFSEQHLSQENPFMHIAEGGDHRMIMAYLAGWQGPVLQEDYDSPEANYRTTKHIQEMQTLGENATVEEIKRAVYQYGAVQASIYMDLKNSFDSSIYYSMLNHSYYYKGEEPPNHDVCIIGWDDTYPADAFLLNTREDGAFICQNGWGEEFGEEGYFYVSYSEEDIRGNTLVYTCIEEVDNYDKMYQTDLCGWSGAIGYGKSSAYAANRFTVKRGELPAAVGFYAVGPDTKYKVYLLEKGGNLEHVLLQQPVAEGEVHYAGYYTIPLTDAKPFDQNQEVTVVLWLDTPEREYPIATEFANDEYTENVDILDGDGYISSNGMVWTNVESDFNCNICMKLYVNIDSNQNDG